MSEFQKALEEAVDGINRQFREFKDAQEAQTKAIAEHGGPDGVLTEKIEKLNEALGESTELKRRLEELETKANRISNARDAIDEDQAEHMKAFRDWFRGGDRFEGALMEAQTKATALVGTVDADGGYLIPEEIENALLNLMRDASPMRSVCDVVRTATSDYGFLVNLHGAATGWVAEAGARAAQVTPTFAEVKPPIGEVFTNLAASQRMLDDAQVDLTAYLSGEIADEFVVAENTSFTTGDGTDQPKGFLDETTAATADASRTFGELEHVATGVSGDWAASNEYEVLIDVSYKLKAGLRQNAIWMMNKAVLGAVRKFVDGSGNLVWRPGLAAGEPETLLGYPVVENEAMTAIAANSLSVAFGDFRRGYRIVDRMGTRLLRDPYTSKPNVLFYATKRVGGKIRDSEAIKLVKFGVS